jgi:poly(beta-D-mannuronate) lyase
MKAHQRILTFALTLMLLIASGLLAQVGRIIEVSTSSQFVQALENLKSGDLINVLPGEYDFQKRIEISIAASEKFPILIRAKEHGTVVLKDQSWFTLKNASFVTIEGFDFKSTDGPAVELIGCRYSRITNNVFHLYETKQSIWVIIKGDTAAPQNRSHHNRIDHNLFENKKLLGNFVAIEAQHEPLTQVSQYDLIDNNYFRNIGPRAENVLEAVRVGWSELSLSSGFTVIEKNLFEKCDGDPEVISIKSSDDTIRHNTFRECLGVLSLRHGNRSTVEGNFFLGNGRTGEFLDSTGRRWTLGTGGVRFYGDNMKVINNYFEGLTGQKWDASLALTSGNTDYGLGQPLTKHYRARYCVVAYNTFINNSSNIEVGYDGEGFQGNWWKMPPVEIIIANNIVVGTNGELIKVFQEPINSTWQGNIVFSKSYSEFKEMFDKNEVAKLDPKLQSVDEIWKLNSKSPVKGKALGSFPYIKNDIDGQLRINKKDPGCDQISNSQIVNKPLTENDVGPSWLKKILK